MRQRSRGFRTIPASIVLCALFACAPATQPRPALESARAQAPHPLDPLSADEIRTAASLLRAHTSFPQGALFSTIVLKEPEKNLVLHATNGSSPAREAFSVILDRKGNRTFEAVVDLSGRRVSAWSEVKGVQPLVLMGEYDEVSQIVKADARWQAAMRKRGLNDFSQLQIDTWAAGQVPPEYQNRRVLRGLTYFKGSAINFYGQPIEGVVALVDMNAGQVVDLIDAGEVPLPPASQELDEASTGTRTPAKPLVITQPEGASFTLNGQEVRWQKWRFRYTMHPREGLVLHMVGYEEDGRVRPILYRASLSEMVVPYGDPELNWRWRSAFDVGEYTVGKLASPIEPGTDAPANAMLINATFADDDGAPEELERAVGIYERDGGLLWKHFDSYSGKNQSRRARQLVIFFIATIGNYDYGINYIFHQDGVLEVDAALTGIMLPKAVRESRVVAHTNTHTGGHLVSANIIAPHHQHFFGFRLDMDVDGQRNVVHEMNTRALPPGDANPALNGMLMEETLLGSEASAGRKMSMESARTWAVVNPSAQNALGQQTSYILVPGPNSLPYIAPTSSVRQRAGFIDNHFWATRYRAAEMSAAGDYPNQSRGGDGLPKWIADDESIRDEDVVVWYTLGVTHIPRPEEWPVMPVTHVGFKLIPGGFFSRNPALDVGK